MVDKLKKQGLSLKEALNTVGMSKSNYFYKEEKRGKKPLNPMLVRALKERKDYELVYGYRKVTQWLQKKKGVRANHKAVLRHMQRLGITQPRKIKGPKGLPLLSYKEPECSNTRWEGDLTYVWCGKDGQGYLFAFVDGYDNEIIGACFTERCRAKEAIEALKKAVAYRFPYGIPKGYKLELRVDRGSQFISRAFMDATRQLGITLEYCGIQCPDDKPYIESFFATYKKEEVYRNDYEDFGQAEAGWQSFKRWYNEDRLNQGLDYLIPKEAALIGTNIFTEEIKSEASLIGAGL